MLWFKCSERLPDDSHKKYIVKKSNGEQIPAFFMSDKISWLAFYGKELTHWMEFESGKLIYNVEEWKEMK